MILPRVKYILHTFALLLTWFDLFITQLASFVFNSRHSVQHLLLKSFYIPPVCNRSYTFHQRSSYNDGVVCLLFNFWHQIILAFQ